MPTDDEAYSLAAVDAALADTAPDDEDEDTAIAIRELAHATSMMTKEQVVARFSRFAYGILKEQKRVNDISDAAAKRWWWLFRHAAGCLDQMKDAFVAGVGKPWVLYPFLFMFALMMAASVGLGDEMMNVGVSLLEHYLDVDVHGHADMKTTPEG